MKKTTYTQTTDVKFCTIPGGGNTGAAVCLSFDNVEYIRIDCKKDCIRFTPAKKVKNDGAFYSKYIRNTNRIYLPNFIMDCYRTNDGKELLGRSAPRVINDNGYSVKVKRIREFNLADYGVSYENVEMPGIEGFQNAETIEYKENAKCLKKAPYFIVDVYYGERTGVIITPTEKFPVGLYHKEDLKNLFGTRFQFCACPHVRYFKTNKIALIPNNWYTQFPDYKNAEYSVSRNGDSVLIQMQGSCMLDNAETRSAEYNSGKRYICNDCLDDAKNQEKELLDLVEGLVSEYEKLKSSFDDLKANYDSAKAENDAKDTLIQKLKEENAAMALGTTPMAKKMAKKVMDEKNAQIEALEEQLREQNRLEVEFLPGTDIFGEKK